MRRKIVRFLLDMVLISTIWFAIGSALGLIEAKASDQSVLLRPGKVLIIGPDLRDEAPDPLCGAAIFCRSGDQKTGPPSSKVTTPLEVVAPLKPEQNPVGQVVNEEIPSPTPSLLDLLRGVEEVLNRGVDFFKGLFMPQTQ